MAGWRRAALRHFRMSPEVLLQFRELRQQYGRCREFCSSPSLAAKKGLFDAGQPTFETHPELVAFGEIMPGISSQEFGLRRQKLREIVPPGSLVILSSASVKQMQDVVPYPFRQDADYLYFTGCQQPGGIAILDDSSDLCMFMPDRSPERQLWDGRLADPIAARCAFGADQAYTIKQIPEFLPEMIRESKAVLLDTASQRQMLWRLPAFQEAVRQQKVQPIQKYTHQIRWIKSISEIQRMREVAQITCQAFLQAMLVSKHWPHESILAATVEYECKIRGAQRMSSLRPCLFYPAIDSFSQHLDSTKPKSDSMVELMRLRTNRVGFSRGAHGLETLVIKGLTTVPGSSITAASVLSKLEDPVLTRKCSRTVFEEVHFVCDESYGSQFPPVVGGGANASVIHYSRNDSIIQQGDMVLMDAGCELNGYVSDMTRCWPPSGTFSDAQRDVYEVVLEALQECLKMCRPQVTLREIHMESGLILSRGLLKLGLAKNDSNLGRTYLSFNPSAVGHYLGMDVHDCAAVSLDVPLQPGVIITIEPALYIPVKPTVPERYQGIGVRIEDEVLITPTGHEILTASAPKEVEEVESWLAQRWNSVHPLAFLQDGRRPSTYAPATE